MAHLDHIDMAVEMHALAWRPAVASRHEVPARIPIAVANRALGPYQFGLKPGLQKPSVQKVADFAVVRARRIKRGNADQVLRQADQVIAPRGHFGQELCRHTLGHAHALLTSCPRA